MLEIKNIRKIFPGQYSPAINDISLKIEKGEFCIIIGSNGSGKSTFLKSILREYSIDSGEIITKSAKIASVNQDINQGTIPEMTLLENMILGSSLEGKSNLSFYSKKREGIIEAVKTLNLGLENYIDQPLKNLSGGQRQMIATLMAINANPDILLLDEHTSALDPKTQSMLMEFTAQHINNKNITCLMITHKLDDAIRYGNRLIMIHKGQIVVDLNKKQKESLTIKQIFSLFH